MASPFDVFTIEDAASPCRSGQRNDFSCMGELFGRRGVYIFLSRETGEVLYIGEAHAQDLKTRIAQHYAEGDTGGTFRQNWCEDTGGTYEQFIHFLSSCTIKVISVTTDHEYLIVSLEATLITVLKPKYNRGTRG